MGNLFSKQANMKITLMSLLHDISVLSVVKIKNTYTTAGGDCNLDGVSSRLAHMLQVQWFVGGFVVPPLDGEGRGVDTDLDGGGPVGVHLPVFMVIAFKLQLEV